MKKVGKKVVFQSSLAFFSVLSLSLSLCLGSICNGLTLTTARGSELEIKISPESTNFKPGEIYSYIISFQAIKFGSDVDRFHQISVCLRFLNSIQTFHDTEYDLVFDKGSYLGELSAVGASLQTELDLPVPAFSLDPGQQITGKLQWKIDFKEGVVMGIDPSYTSDWETIVDGKISVPPNNSGIFILGLGLIVVIVVIIIYIIKPKAKETPLGYSPQLTQRESPPKPQSSSISCPKCGIINEPNNRYCSGCGQQILFSLSELEM